MRLMAGDEKAECEYVNLKINSKRIDAIGSLCSIKCDTNLFDGKLIEELQKNIAEEKRKKHNVRNEERERESKTHAHTHACLA